MKKNILFISAALLLFSLNLTAQDWVSMMRNPKVNVHDVQNAFNKWYNQKQKTDKDKGKTIVKKDEEKDDESYELFKRWEWYNLPRADVNGNRADLNKVGTDYENYLKSNLAHNPPSNAHSMHRFTPSSGSWFYAGNTTVPTNSSSGNGGNGRVNRVRIFPGNPNIMFACAASGGLWKTTNGGTTWATTTDQLGDLTTSDVVINPSKTNVMYLATGDGDGLQSIYPTPATIGVLKSSDGGATWVATGLTYTLTFAGNNNYSVNELIMDPADTAVLIAATSFGIYRTTNSGATWTQTQAGWFHSVEFEPSHPAIVYAAASNLFAGGAKFYRSVDNGITWTNIAAGLPSSAAAEGFDIGVTAADSTVVYVLADNVSTYDYNGLYRSTNHGVSFTKQSGSPTLPNVLGRAQSGNDYGVGQGWYDLTMAVSQTNRDSVWVGGINIWSSSNGGVNWTLNADWTGSGAPFVHADMHDIQFIPGTNSKGYVVGCDGGIFITLNSGTNWSNISNNIEIAQQYSVGPSATVAGKWLTGWQDNGTNLSSSPWAQVLGGDGMVCFIDWSVPAQTTFYGENPQGQLSKSTNAGATWNGITTGITETGPWVTQWCQDPKTAATLYSGFQNIWKSTNSGGSWSKISTWGTSSITALAVDSSNTNFIYAAQSNMIQLTTNGGTTWTNITGTLPVGSASISAIAVSSKLPSHAWVTFSGYSGNEVFVTVNSGATWTNISAGLPSLPVNCIVSESGSPNGIYVGTDQGVYYHDTVTNAWTFFNTGLPMVMIGDLKIYQAGHQIIAGTYGRGTWESPLFSSGPCVPPTVVVTNTPVLCNGGSTGSATATPSGGTLPYTYAWTPSAGTNATAPGLSAGTYTVTVQDALGCSVTASTTITQPPVLTASIGSVNNVKCSFTATGSATVTAGGGTPGYTYAWTPAGGTNATASNLSAGTYTINVTDNNGCNVSASVTITQPTITTANITTIVNVKCNGGSTGSLTVTAGGGTPAYTYAWTPSGGTGVTASNLSAGTYTITVTDANGCTATASATITEPAVLTTTTSTTPATCASNNGTATATPAGGTSPYTYAWTPGGATSATASNLSVGTYTVTVTDANGCTVTASAIVASGGGLTASISGTTDVKCNGAATGSATATQVGGTAPYTYSWAPSGGTNATASNLTAGTYTVTVTDKNGCTGTASATITQPTALTTTTSTVFATCNGSNGSATANPSGGTSPYTYSWAPGGNTNQTATGLSGGTYTVTVTDANGCTATAFATVGNTGGVAVAISAQTDENCNGDAIGSATSNPSGGTLPYTYNWTPSGGTNQLASGLTAGTYTITVTDAHGCTGTASATITQPAVLTTTTSVTPETCSSSNGTATATPAGGTSPYTYSWAPGGQTTAAITGLTAGTYTVNVTDAHGCTVTATATVASVGGLTVTIANTGVLCNGGGTGTATATASAGTAPYTYFWTPSGGTNATASNLTAGTYTCSVTDKNGCTGSASTTITQPAVLTVTTGAIVNVKCNGGATGSATATPAGGTAAYTYDWAPGGNTNQTATGLTAGTYTVTVTDKNGCMATATAVITQPTVLTASTSGIVNVKCNGGATGSATATAGGGTPAYTYNWAPGGNTNATATGLTAGTYTVTVTDANGCTATATAVVTQPTALTVTTGGIVNVNCNGAATGSATATPAGGTVPYTYSWAPGGQTNSTASGLTAGTYTVTVTDANGCTATATAVITQPPVLTVTVVNTPVKCNGGSTGTATATVGGGTPAYTYNWTPSGGSGVTATGLSAGTYTITVTDANGCTATASTTITQPAVLSVAVVNTGVKCNGGATGTATATPAGGTVPYTYAWTPSGGTNATATGLSAGTYTITVTDKNGCTVTASTTITQPTSLTVTTTINSNVSCNGGNNGKITANPSGGTPAYTYSWSDGETTVTASNLTAGCFTVTVTDANGCTATASACLTQPPVLTVVVTNTPVKCNGGATGTATATPGGGTPGYTYNWTPVGGTNATASNLTAGTYTITVKDANGCIVTASTTITQPVVLTVAVVNTPVKCNGGATGTATATPAGGTGAYTYNWTPSGGTNAIATGLTAGTYTITVTDANACTATASTIITQPPVLTVITGGIVNEKCNGGSTGSINAVAGGGTPAYTYAWAPSGGSGATASNLTAGTYTITVKDANGCTATASGTITQPPALTVVVTNTPIKCNGGANGTATATPGGGTPAYTYAWTPVGGTNATATGLSVGTYTITVKDANGCSITASTTITQPPVLTAVITASSPVTCNGGNNGSATVTAGGGSPAYTYNWSPSGGTNSTTTALTAGTYTATVTDANGCTATAAVVITQPPAMTVTPSAPVICSGGNVILTASGAVTYSWSPATGLSATVGATVTASPTVTTMYTVTGTAGACVTTATVLVTVNPTPVITLTPPASNLCSGDSLTIIASGANSYTWAPAAGLSNTVGLIVTAFPAVTTTYTVTGTSNGCSGTATVTITVTPTPTVTVNPSSPAPICSGGNVSLTASGAVTYSWSPATGLSATVGATVTASPTVTTSYTVTGTNGSCSSIATVVVTVNPTPTVTVTPAAASICTGGAGTNLTASGASTYTWAPAAGLSATTGSSVTANPAVSTTYTVTGTTGTCSSIQMVTITVNPTPTVTVVPSSGAICSGKSVSLTASGAATYSWAPATGLSATVGATVTASPTVTTSYTVTGTNGSCTGTAVVLISVSPTPTVVVTPSAPSICASGPGVTLTASGAAGYSWSPATGLSGISGPVVTATPTITTTYTIVGTSPTGCQDTAKVTVTVDSAIVAKIAGKDTICAGDSTTLTASGGGTYRWNTGSTNASITVAPSSNMPYSVTVTVGGCSASANVNVVVNKAAVINIIQTGDTLKCTPTGLTYQWYKGNNPIVGSTFDSLHTNTTGTYKVYVTNSSGCSDTGIYVISGFAGINEVSLSENINIYPNPSTGNVQIECNIPEGEYTMSMTDVLGQVLFTESMHVNGVYRKTMNMYNYSSGVYILSIRGENTMTEKKIILNK